MNILEAMEMLLGVYSHNDIVIDDGADLWDADNFRENIESWAASIKGDFSVVGGAIHKANDEGFLESQPDYKVRRLTRWNEDHSLVVDFNGTESAWFLWATEMDA